MTVAPVIWLPDALDHLEHAVSDSEVVRAGAAGVGHVVAVCSASVLLCSLATPAAPRCPRCDAYVTGDHVPTRILDRLRLPWRR